MELRMIHRRPTKRKPQMRKGLLPTDWMVKVEGDEQKAWRRVYEDWNRPIKTPMLRGHMPTDAPRVISLQDKLVDLTPAQRIQVEAVKDFWNKERIEK